MRIGKGTLVRWKKGNQYSQGRIEMAYRKENKAKTTDGIKKAFLIKQDDGGMIMKMDDEIEVMI